MKKFVGLMILSCFVVSLAVASFAQSQERISKLEREISKLESTLAKTKNRTQRLRLQKTINDYKKEVAELKKEMSPAAASSMAAGPSGPAAPKTLMVKGGLAGGAGLIAGEFFMPMGPMNVGGELGYAIGSNFGIIDAGVKATYSLGMPFVGLEISYAGYSKDVTNVPGLSGTIKSGIGLGLVGGTNIGPVLAQVGYNTIFGLRADAGYRIKI
ncbi:hypothetical protein HZC35_06485 [Candidatus Saganbacteria bacterium]|nr:hypothetical protein [Candidatus Saganbacteria bacterium]